MDTEDETETGGECNTQKEFAWPEKQQKGGHIVLIKRPHEQKNTHTYIHT